MYRVVISIKVISLEMKMGSYFLADSTGNDHTLLVNSRKFFG